MQLVNFHVVQMYLAHRQNKTGGCAQNIVGNFSKYISIYIEALIEDITCSFHENN